MTFNISKTKYTMISHIHLLALALRCTNHFKERGKHS